MPLERANPTHIEKRNPTSIELGGGALPPPTEVPGTPTFALTALPAAIALAISRPQTGGRAQGYRYRVRRRNAADTAWENVQAWVDLGSRRSATITQYSTTQAIEVGRRYEVRVIAYNIIGDGTQTAYQEVTPVTNLSAVPTYALEAHDEAIRLTLNKVADPLMARDPTYEYFIEERNAADTAWVPDVDGSQIITSDPFGAAGTHRIISDTDTQLIIDVLRMRIAGQSSHDLINDRAYRIRVRSENDAGYSAWSAYMSATPMAGVMPAQRPGLPTFTFAALRYEYDATGDEVSATVNFNPRPNADGVGVTHWLFRYRERGTTTWQTQTVVAQPELDTVYGFRLDEDDIGNTYEVQVASRNNTGDSAYTAIQTILVAEPLLPAPTFTITYQPFTRDPLYFTCDPVAPVNPVLPVSGYDIRYREVGTTAWATVGHSLDILNVGYFVELTDRFIGRQLEVQMRAVNEYAGGVWSASQTLQIIGVPNRPDLFLTAQAGGFDVRIVNSPAGYRAVGFGFRYREQGTTDWTGGSTLEIRNLDGLTVYEVQGWSENPAGRSLQVSRTVTTLAVMRVTGRLAVYGDNLAVYGDNLKVYGA